MTAAKCYDCPPVEEPLWKPIRPLESLWTLTFEPFHKKDVLPNNWATSLCLESPISSSLRGDPISLRVRKRGWCSLCEHQSRSTEDGGVVLLLLLLSFSGFALLVIPFQFVNGWCLLADKIDHKGHGEVGEPVTPREFHYNIKSNQVMTCIKHAHIALPATNIDKLKFVLACVTTIKLRCITYIAK